MKLLGENVPHLEHTEVVLVLRNIVNNDYQQDSRYCTLLYQRSHLVVY